MKVGVFFILLLSGLLGFSLSLYQYKKSAPVIVANNKPAVFHSPVSFVAQLKNDPKAGEKIFKEFCASCHSSHPVIDVNAPRLNDKKTWKIIKKRGINTLLEITITGRGIMPARGGCFECSDKQLKETIQYILN